MVHDFHPTTPMIDGSHLPWISNDLSRGSDQKAGGSTSLGNSNGLMPLLGDAYFVYPIW